MHAGGIGASKKLAKRKMDAYGSVQSHCFEMIGIHLTIWAANISSLVLHCQIEEDRGSRGTEEDDDQGQGWNEESWSNQGITQLAKALCRTMGAQAGRHQPMSVVPATDGGDLRHQAVNQALL